MGVSNVFCVPVPCIQPANGSARLASGDSDQRASTIRVIKLLRVVRTLRIVKTVACWSDDTVDR